MALTRDFKETVMARARRDRRPSPTIADHRRPSPTIADHRRPSPTIADHRRPSPAIAGQLNLNEKSLRRMLGPAGNPTLKNFINLLTACSRIEHLQLHVCQH